MDNDTVITVLYGTQTGNSEELAERTVESLEENDFEARVMDMADADIDFLQDEKVVLVIVSTWGDGEPPDEALPFYEAFVEADSLELSEVHFSVCSLGDTDYEEFCKCGKDFDEHLERHGGKRIYKRVDCDVDYDEDYENWFSEVLKEIKKI